MRHACWARCSTEAAATRRASSPVAARRAGPWSVEQCLNLWLAQQRPAPQDLLELPRHASTQMREWLDTVARDPNATVDAAPLVRIAQGVREASSFAPAGHAIPDLMAGH